MRLPEIYKQYNFQHSDLRNFLILLASEFKRRDLELIPDGLILKEPRAIDTEWGNTSVDLIGIPFKHVFGRTTVNYYRIKLSDFAREYRIQMGTPIFPIRLKRSEDQVAMEAAVASALEARIGISKLRFIVERISRTEQLDTFSFKFKIEPTEFTTEDNGFCLINDEVQFVYATDPNVKIQNGIAKIELEDKISVTSVTNSSLSFINTNAKKKVSSKESGYPEEFRIPTIIRNEWFPKAISNEVIFEGFGSILNITIPQFIMDSVSRIEVPSDASLNGDRLTMHIENGEERPIVFYTKYGKEYTLFLDSGAAKYSGPNVIEPISINTSSNSSSRISIRKYEVTVKKIRLIEDLYTRAAADSSSSIISKTTQFTVKHTEPTEKPALNTSTDSCIGLSITVRK